MIWVSRRLKIFLSNRIMTDHPKHPAQGTPPLELPEDLEPIYSNLARISHTPSELTIDFSRILPGQQKLSVLVRVLLSPVGAKLLLRALAENLARYEAAFGEIRLPGDTGLADSLFKSVIPPNPPKNGNEDE